MSTTSTPHSPSISAMLTSQGKAVIALPMMAAPAILPMTARDLFDPSSIFKPIVHSAGQTSSRQRLKHNHSKLFRLKTYLCEATRCSEDRLQDHPAVHDECHEETQHAA